MTFKESYEKKGEFTRTGPDGTQVTRKFTLRYRFTDKMTAPEVIIKGNPGDKAIADFLADVKARYHRAFQHLGSNRVEYLDELK